MKRPRRFAFRIPPNAEPLFAAGLVVVDALVLNAVVLSVYHAWLGDAPSAGLYLSAYYNVRPLLAILYFGFGLLANMFSIRQAAMVAENFANAATSLLATFVSFNLLVVFSRHLAMLAHTFPRPVLFISAIVAIFALFLLRVALTVLFIPYPILRRAFIVGDADEGRRILRQMRRFGGVRFKILRTFDTAQLERLAAEVVFHRVDEIVITDARVSLDRFWSGDAVLFGEGLKLLDGQAREVADGAALESGFELGILLRLGVRELLQGLRR